MSHKGVDGRGRYSNEVGNSLRSKRDEPMGEEGGCKPEEYKGWPRPSRRLALAAPESSRDIAE